MPITALGADTGEAEDNVGVLADMGATIVLLGFGGVGDVGYLEDLPVHSVEIARQVVQRIAQQPDGGSGVIGAVPVMVRLVHCCGVTVIARGVELKDEAEWWRSAGADVGQGAFCAPPGAPEDIAVLLGAHWRYRGVVHRGPEPDVGAGRGQCHGPQFGPHL